MRRNRSQTGVDWAKSEIRRNHPTASDLAEFALQHELLSWHLLWWEKQEQMNKIWWHRFHGGTKM